MTGSTPSRLAPRAGAAALLAVLAVTLLGVWPYAGTLGFDPMALDSVHWLLRSAVGREGWQAWSFGGPHFIAYRPVAALSFSLTSVFVGLDPLPHRCFDLALHAVNGLLVFAVARRLAPAAPAGIAVVAAAVFLWHPAAEEVVPWLARRHNGLACAFSLAALLATLRALAPGARGAHSAAAAACVAAALLSNEVAVTLLFGLPLCAFAMRPARADRGAVWASLWPPLAAGAVTLVLRLARVGGIGGYEPAEAGPERAARVWLAFWRDLLGPETGPERLVAAAGALGLVAVAVAARRRSLVPLAFSAWLAGASLLLAAQQVWFARELYALLPIFALLVALALHDTWKRPVPFARRSALLAPQLLLLALLAFHSPVLRGPDRQRIELWSAAQATLADLRQHLDTLEGPAELLLAVAYPETPQPRNTLRPRPDRPGPPRSARIPALWLSALYEPAGIALREIVAFPEPPDAAPPVRFSWLDGRPALLFPPGRRFFVEGTTPPDVRESDSGTVLWIDGLGGKTAPPRWLYLRSAGSGSLTRWPTR